MLGKKVCNLTLEKSGLCNIEKKGYFGKVIIKIFFLRLARDMSSAKTK